MLFLLFSLVSIVTAWVHPGVLVGQTQLNEMKLAVQNHQNPVYGEFLKAQASVYGSLNYAIQGPPANGAIQCGSYSHPNVGCSAADNDAGASYVQSLLWYITGIDKYRQNAVKILETYAAKLRGYAGWTKGVKCPNPSSTCSNGPLQAAWDASKFPRALEILRAGNSTGNWPAIEQMLTTIHLPLIYSAHQSNNWGLSMIEAMMGIAVATENASLLADARAKWASHVPAYCFYAGLAPTPSPKGWYGQLVFNTATTGVCMETCRDLSHTEYGLAAAINAAETDWLQGGDLYAREQTRLIASLNLHATLESHKSTTAPASFCTGSGRKIQLGIGTTYVIAYNHYHARVNASAMALCLQWIQTGRAGKSMATDGGAHMIFYEGLTHGFSMVGK